MMKLFLAHAVIKVAAHVPAPYWQTFGAWLNDHVALLGAGAATIAAAAMAWYLRSRHEA